MMIPATMRVRRSARRAALSAAAAAAGTLFLGVSQSLPANAGLLKYFGGNLAWTQYGSTFTGAYDAGTMGTYLSEFQSDHLNFIRVWVCEGFDGLSFDSSGNCTGISQTLLNNVANFASQANSKGICVEFVFLNSQDVQSRPGIVAGNRTALINNALVPLGKAIQPYNCQIDLINEGNVATNVASWSTLRSFGAASISALHSAGVNRWITMSDQNTSDFTSSFYSTIGGVGFDFYEYHGYNGDGSINVSSGNVDKPLELNEYGPGSGWDNLSYSTNKTTLGNFVNNAMNQGYFGAAFWTYIGDGNFQLRGNQLMGDISYWGNYMGIGATSGAPIGKRIAIKAAASGFYTSCDLNTADNLRAAWSTSPGTWEQFDVVDAGGGQIALHSPVTGYYVSCDLNNGDDLRAAFATSIQGWEKFTWQDLGNGSFALKSSATGFYVSCDLNTSDTLRAAWATSAQGWETFSYITQ